MGEGWGAMVKDSKIEVFCEEMLTCVVLCAVKMAHRPMPTMPNQVSEGVT